MTEAAVWMVHKPGRANTESSVSPPSPAGMDIKTLVVFDGQNSVGSLPDSAQTVAAIWLLQTSVGTEPLAKYSV